MSRTSGNIILFVDDDQILSNVIHRYLSAVGYEVVTAGDGRTALDLFDTCNPDLVIVDLYMPVMGGIQFVEEARKKNSDVPIIVTTGYPDVDSAIKAIQLGALDYLKKPFQLEVLHQKIRQALSAERHVQDGGAMSGLVSLFEITRRLTNARDIQSLLDVTFQYCLDVSGAAAGSIQVIDKISRELVTVNCRSLPSSDNEPENSGLPDPETAQWVLKHEKPVLQYEGRIEPRDAGPGLAPGQGSAVMIPLRISGKTIGLVSLWRTASREPFSSSDSDILQILVTQAGIAIDNAQLYASVNQKLDELSLIGTYSEQLRGLTDERDVVGCLFDAVPKYFAVDMMGFLMAQKRRHQFLYWTRGTIEREDVDRICGNVIAFFNEKTESAVSARRIHTERRAHAVDTGLPVAMPMRVEYMLPVAWEDFSYGAVYFGASREPESWEEKKALLSSLVNQTRIALTNAKLYGDMKENYIRTIKALAIAVDAKDTYTHGHSENVMNLAEEIAVKMNIEQRLIGIIRDAALLHDIGKIGIPGYILNKPGPLTYEEFNGIMKTHSSLGANIVRDVPFLHDLYTLILYHHEHYDGTGYPEGRKGEDIPQGARILHVADAFEAMTSNRPYRQSLGIKEAVRRLLEGAGEQFDPEIVNALVRIAREKGWVDG